MPRRFLYPRLIHAALEVWGAYLDGAVMEEIRHAQTDDDSEKKNKKKIRLVSMGAAGYNVRSIKLTQRGLADECHELDLPEVVRIDETSQVYRSIRHVLVMNSFGRHVLRQNANEDAEEEGLLLYPIVLEGAGACAGALHGLLLERIDLWCE